MTQIDTDYHGFYYLNPFDLCHPRAIVFEFSIFRTLVGEAPKDTTTCANTKFYLRRYETSTTTHPLVRHTRSLPTQQSKHHTDCD